MTDLSTAEIVAAVTVHRLFGGKSVWVERDGERWMIEDYEVLDQFGTINVWLGNTNGAELSLVLEPHETLTEAEPL